MEIKDYIHVRKNGISTDLCDDILKEYVPTYEWKVGTVGENNVEEEIRKCDSIFISKDSVIELNEDIRKDLDDRIFQSVSECIGEYLNKYSDFPSNISRDSGYSLLRYKSGDYIRQHIDASGRSPRELSCSLILNDNYDGGEFAFFNQKLKFDLKRGDIIMFPSNFMFPHEVLPVTSGVRYAIITWIC